MTDRYQTNQYQGQSSEEIKQNIERTRHQMSEKIDAIQDKFSPDNLKAQAQETVEDMVTDGADAVVNYVRANSQDLGHSLTEAVRRNPLPSALIGIGLGWLVLESMRSDQDDEGYAIQRYRRRPQARYINPGYRYDESYDPDYEMYETYDEYLDDLNNGAYETRTEENGSYRAASANRYRRPSGGYRRSYQSAPQDDSSFIDEAQEQVAGATESIQEGLSHAVDQVQETVAQAGAALEDQVDEFGNRVSHQAGRVRRNVRNQSAQMQSRARHARDEAAWRAEQAQRRAGQWGAEAGHYTRETMDENPLMVGFGAFAIGALAGILLPQTRAENRWMGETRDQVMETAQEIGADMVNRAENVVEEVRPEVENTVRQVASDVKQSGREAAESLKDAGQKAAEQAQETMEKAQATAKAEGEKAKAEAKLKIKEEARRQSES